MGLQNYITTQRKAISSLPSLPTNGKYEMIPSLITVKSPTIVLAT
jgi:hypothetical protein